MQLPKSRMHTTESKIKLRQNHDVGKLILLKTVHASLLKNLTKAISKPISVFKHY